jgi:SAM-dependent methyltransferase
MNATIANRNWNQRYLTGDTPWAAHTLLTPVLDVIQALYPKKNASILEVGCGYGQEAIALAKLDYYVTAVDLSSVAIAQAKLNAQAAKVNIHFQAFDLLHDQSHFVPFDLVLDIAVLHTMDNNDTRYKFAQAVAALLKPQGAWINVSCLSPDVLKVAESTGVKAPPALTKVELQHASNNNFLLATQQLTIYQLSREGKLAAFPALISLFKKIN